MEWPRRAILARSTLIFCSTVSYAIFSSLGFPRLLSENLHASETFTFLVISSPRASVRSLATRNGSSLLTSFKFDTIIVSSSFETDWLTKDPLVPSIPSSVDSERMLFSKSSMRLSIAANCKSTSTLTAFILSSIVESTSFLSFSILLSKVLLRLSCPFLTAFKTSNILYNIHINHTQYVSRNFSVIYKLD